MQDSKTTLIESLLAKTIKNDGGCLIWVGATDRHGYGRAYISGRLYLAHRAHYELVHGTTDGKELDHLCYNPACINLDHLEPVSHSENIRRSWARRKLLSEKTTCFRGHPYTPEDLTRDKRGWKSCRACNKLAVKKYLAKKRLQQVGGE